MIPHRRFRGSTGSGKTNAAAYFLRKYGIEGEYWITAVFPHPQWGELLIAELYHDYGEAIFDRLIVERLSDTDRIIPRQFLYSSSDPDPYKRAMENDEYRGAWVDTYLPSQSIGHLSDQAFKYKYMHLAGKVKQNQKEWWPESWLSYVLEKHAVHDHAKQNMMEDRKDLTGELEELDKMAHKERFIGPGSASRLIDTVNGNPVMQVRTCMPETFDWVQFKNKGGIHIILGGNVSKDALRVHVGADFQRTVRDAKRRLLHPGIYFIDEATNYGLYGQFESDALSTVRAFGVSMWHAIQSENYPEEIKQNVSQNVEDYVFLQLDPDESLRAARTLNASRDRYKVHHEDVSFRSVETEEFIERKGKSITKGDKKSVTESTQLIPKKREEEVRTARYEALSDQTDFMSQELMTLLPGECWVNERGRAPHKTRVPLFEDSWGLRPDRPWERTLSQEKADECINLLKQRPPYVTPVVVPFPVQDKTTTSSGGSGKNKPSQNLPKPPSRPGNWSKKK